MKMFSMILAGILVATGMTACDRVKEDDARKGIPQADVRTDEKPPGNAPSGGVGAKNH